jgi:hypothetical protein
VAGLSGDEVDTSLIIEGGRRSRRGRGGGQPIQYKTTAVQSDSGDEW